MGIAGIPTVEQCQEMIEILYAIYGSVRTIQDIVLFGVAILIGIGIGHIAVTWETRKK